MKRGVQSRIARFAALAATAAVLALTGAPSAVADSTNRVGVCFGEVVSGVEVDNCVPNPNADITSDVPGVNVELEGGVGLSLGG